MRVRKIMAALCTTAALTALAVQPSHALAAHGAPASRPAVTTVAPGAKAPSYHYIRDFWTYRGCMTAGAEGVEMGRWTKFKCVDGGTFWDLYGWY